jgi:predicted ribosomally synthesized peptide with SipW-like signal peptide
MNGRRGTDKRRIRKVELSLALLVLAFCLIGLGAFATFTSSTSASHSVTTGTVTIALGATGASTNRLNVNATGIAPTDTIQRSFDLINQGTLNLVSITLTSAATASSLLDTDATNGLQMAIDKCSVAWTESGSSPAFSYTCSGSTTVVLASRAVVGTNVALASLGALTAGVTDHLRLTLTLPVTADNSFQNQASTIQYTFTGAH